MNATSPILVRLLWALCSLVTLLCAIPAEATSKRDVVVIDNGDRLTGEIKGMERGKLSFKTTATDQIQVEWENVVSITGLDYYALEREDGTKLFGAIRPDTTDASRLVVWSLGGAQSIPLQKIVVIRVVKTTFWGRIDGSVDFGFSYTQASVLLQYTLSSNASYRQELFDTGYRLNSTLNVQDSVTTARHELEFSFTRYLPSKKLATGRISLQSNKEQGFDLRLTASGGPGAYLWNDHHKVLALVLGLSLNNEVPVDGSATTSSLEGMVSSTFSLFYYQSPKRSVDMTVNLYPGITDRGRFRSDFNGKLRVEVISDFFVAMTLIHSYDSEPPVEGAANNDVVITTSLGYSF